MNSLTDNPHDDTTARGLDESTTDQMADGMSLTAPVSHPTDGPHDEMAARALGEDDSKRDLQECTKHLHMRQRAPGPHIVMLGPYWANWMRRTHGPLLAQTIELIIVKKLSRSSPSCRETPMLLRKLGCCREAVKKLLKFYLCRPVNIPLGFADEADAEACRNDPVGRGCDVVRVIHASGLRHDEFFDTLKTGNLKNWFHSPPGIILKVLELELLHAAVAPKSERSFMVQVVRAGMAGPGGL
ncbi:hypothetical protein BU15DRAFT_67028 [Melanogaster broomeanus]|nr:hypothetical protein BU15DRAFT_67028 [Melanogaster broomeanus]